MLLNVYTLLVADTSSCDNEDLLMPVPNTHVTVIELHRIAIIY